MKPIVKKATKKSAKTQAPSQGRADKGVREGREKSQQLADRFQAQAFVAGIRGDHPEVIKSTGYGGAKKTKGNSTPRAKAADAAFGSYKKLANKGK